MTLNNIQLILAIVFSCYFSGISGDCIIRLNSLGRDQPLFLTSDNKILAPSGLGFIKVGSAVEIKIACPGDYRHINFDKKSEKNLLADKTVKTAKITCVSEETFRFGEKDYLLSSIGCNLPIQPAISSAPSVKCAQNRGEKKRVGFQIDDHFLQLFDICYDMSAVSVIYTHNIIKGASIDFRDTSGGKASFNDLHVPLITNLDKLSKYQNQQEWLQSQLGQSTDAKMYVNKNDYLNRGHLNPHSDSVFIPEQRATYLDINTAPQWKSVNGGNWGKVEERVRKAARSLGADFEVYTGVIGELKLPTRSGQEVPFKLRADLKAGGTMELSVPKWFWKIVKTGDSGIAFVSLNNPYVSSQSICPNICDQYKWNVDSFTILEKGLIFCCEVSKLMEVIHDIPAEARVNNVLRNPSN